MNRPKALDLFCGGGGGALGLIWAGFEVYGVDLKPGKNYPGIAVIADVFNLPFDIHNFDYILASPPCQRYSIGTKSQGPDKWKEHPDLVPPTRELIKDHPFWCMENVPGSPMSPNVILRGPQLGLDSIWRKRLFETSFVCFEPPDVKMDRSGCYTTVTTTMCSNNHYYRRKAEGKRGKPSAVETKHMMGIPICARMTRAEVGNSISPIMSYWIARQAIQQITGKTPEEIHEMCGLPASGRSTGFYALPQL